MEAKAEGDPGRERRRWEPAADRSAAPAAGEGGEVACGPPLSGTSYWLDFWFMILLDLALFIFVYLLP